MAETFRATIQQTGKTACGIEVPEAIVAALGGSKRPAVTVDLGGDRPDARGPRSLRLASRRRAVSGQGRYPACASTAVHARTWSRLIL